MTRIPVNAATPARALRWGAFTSTVEALHA